MTSVFPAPDATRVDPVTEIRIRFDRPMDPNNMGLEADQGDARNVFRLRESPRYLSQNNEFVLPVLLRPGMQLQFQSSVNSQLLRFLLQRRCCGGPIFVAIHHARANGEPQVARPRVLSVDPPSGSQTGIVTTSASASIGRWIRRHVTCGFD